MFLADFFAALIIGSLIVFLISLAFRTKGPWGSMLWFFIVVSLFAWVAGVWLRPYGPVWFGVGWIPIIFVGFLVAFLLTSVSPREPRRPMSLKEETISVEERKTAVDAFFWILIMLLVFLAVSHYYWYRQIGWY
jgi:hypothetical protein